MPTNRRLSSDDVACWVIKTRTAPRRIVPGWVPGTEQRLHRCLRRSYRVELMAAGQRCLLWLSGSDEPGVHAIGTLSGPAEPVPAADPARSQSEVAVDLMLLTTPISRAALRANPRFHAAEVLQMPAGSNPSYLSADRLAVLSEFLDPAEQEKAGW